MNKTINTVVELTEKDLACVTGGGIIVGGRFEGGKEGGRFERKSSAPSWTFRTN